MKKDKKDIKDDAVSTFLGHGAAFDGTLEFTGTVRLDGKLKGKISSAGGTVIIGEKAHIEAEINVDTVIVKGRVSGVVDARKRFEAYPPADISGEIRAPVICIDSGVLLNGTCVMEIPAGISSKTN
jgi:cytoskeletal protein CcmA (bactofilin family)